MNNCLQFIGTQRSGSNLLRVMLHQLPDVSAPHPPHLLQVLMPLLPMYGDLGEAENFNRLINDACRITESNPVNWGVELPRETVRAKCAGINLPQVVKAIYELKAEAKGATWWCCKSMAAVHYAAEIEAAGIHPFYIWLYRDGRDVALSFLKAVVGDKHVYQLAKQWNADQEAALQVYEQVGPERCMRIAYEEFVRDPTAVVKAICAHTGIPFSDTIMEYARSEESRETAASGKMWANLTQPVNTANTGKFRLELTPEDIAIFEQTAGKMLHTLGYLNECPPVKTFSLETLAAFAAENKKRIAAHRITAGEDLEKRAKQDAVLAELRQRFQTFLAAV